MAGSFYSVEGVGRVIGALHAFELGVENVKDTSGPKAVADEARRTVPVRTGALRSTIESGPNVIEAGGTLPYAKVIHFGWPAHHIEPQPFLYEAVRDKQLDIVIGLNTEIKKLAVGAGLNVLY